MSEKAVGRHRRDAYIAMDGRIGDLWDQYDDHDIVCEDFLKEVGYIYSVNEL